MSDIHDDGGQERKSVTTEDLVEKVNKMVCEKRSFVSSKPSSDICHISRSVLYGISKILLEWYIGNKERCLGLTKN